MWQLMKVPIQICEQTVPPRDMQLGAVYDAAAQSCRFSLWAPTSRAVSVHLYQNAGDLTPAFTVPLRYDDATGLWCGSFAERDPELFFYDYTLTNEMGTHTVLDPYSLSMAAYTGNGGIGRGAIINLQKETLKPEREYPYITMQKREDAIIYEVSVRDFTASPDSGVKNIPGTYGPLSKKSPIYANWVLHIFS